jgi:chemotaxis protein histidine kinase CheA
MTGNPQAVSDSDEELVGEYLAECREHLATIETDLLAIEGGGEGADKELVNRVFRAAHSIKGGAGFFGLTRIGSWRTRPRTFWRAYAPGVWRPRRK